MAARPMRLLRRRQHDQLIGDLTGQNGDSRRLARQVVVFARAEQVAGGAVGLQHAHLRIERDHPAGNRLKHGFKLAAALLERAIGGGELGGGGLSQGAGFLPDPLPCD